MKFTSFRALIYFTLFVITLACTSTQQATTGARPPKETTGVYQSLVDYLRRHPSVRVIGTGEDVQVFVRGIDTLIGEIEPLFVVDGSLVGESYAEANRIVDVNDIKSVNVLNAIDATNQYGLRGSRGAVVIKTKRNE